MAARGIRDTSVDVDFFSPVIDEDVVHTVEKEMKAVYGQDFKIDATPTENLWGPIIFRDLADAEQIKILRVANSLIPIKALSIDDLVLVKLAADRTKDRHDLALLAPEIETSNLVTRFNTVIGWYGDRSSVMSFTDRFVGFLEDRKGIAPSSVIAELSVPDYIKEMLFEARSNDADIVDEPIGPKRG